ERPSQWFRVRPTASRSTADGGERPCPGQQTQVEHVSMLDDFDEQASGQTIRRVSWRAPTKGGVTVRARILKRGTRDSLTMPGGLASVSRQPGMRARSDLRLVPLNVPMRLTYRLAGGLALGVCVTVGVRNARAQKAPESTWDGVYTEAQAQRGKAAYSASCASCHGEGLLAKRGGDIPSLTGEDFEFNWYNQTVADRFERIRATMPPASKGSLTGQVVADILAYILQFNGYPPGNGELKPDIEGLKHIVIQSIRPTGGAPSD